MSDLNFSIKGVSENPTKFVAEARNFKIVIDEPPTLGGTDHGANPVEYLLASYAGCINVVAHLTARELGIKVEKLRIEISGIINPARLFGQSDAERAGFKQIDIAFLPVTNATPELTEQWIAAIKNRCPINDNLASPTPLSFKFIQNHCTEN